MKIILAIVRPEKVPDVKQSLWKEKISMMTLTDVKGCGTQKGYTSEYRGIIEEVKLHRKAMIMIGVNDSYIKKTVDAIIKGAKTNGKTGNVGDGKIFVLPLEDCVRIRTGETGAIAIGGTSEELKDSTKNKI